MGRGRVAPQIKNNDWTSVRQAINRLSALILGSEAEPTYAGLTLTGTTASRLISTDGDKKLTSADLVAWVAGSSTIAVTDDTDGSITLDVIPGGIDHGALAGLTDDDHTLYFLADGSRALSGDWTWLGASNAEWSDARKAINLLGDDNVALNITGLGQPYLQIKTTTGSEALNFGNPVTNQDYNFFGTGITSLGGSLEVSGNLEVAGGVISSAGGVISFVNENLRTKGFVEIGEEVLRTEPPFDGDGADLAVTSDVNDTKGVLISNKNTGIRADQRLVLLDNTGNYTAFSLPSVNNTSGNLFGMSRQTTSFLFNAGGTVRDIAIGTIGAKSLVFGTSDTKRITITSAGDTILHGGSLVVGGGIITSPTGAISFLFDDLSTLGTVGIGVSADGGSIKLDVQGVGSTTTGARFFFDADSGGIQPELRIYGHDDGGGGDNHLYGYFKIGDYNKFLIGTTGTTGVTFKSDIVINEPGDFLKFPGTSTWLFGTTTANKQGKANGFSSGLFVFTFQDATNSRPANFFLGRGKGDIDYGHPYTEDPTFIIQSGSNTPAQYIKFYHDRTDANIKWGFGNLVLTGGNVGIGVTDPDAKLEVFGTGTQLKLSYDATNYSQFTTGSDGDLTITTVDSDGAAGNITLNPDGSTILNSNVRIGDNTAPTETLEVVGVSVLGDGGATNYAQISATGDLVFVGTAGMVFGSMYNDNTSTTLTITDTTPVQIPSGFTAGQLNGVTFGNDRELTVTEPGMYNIVWSISFNTAGGTNQEIEGAIAIGGTRNAQGSSHRFIGTPSDIGSMCGVATLDLADNAVVSLIMANLSDSQDIVVTHSSLSLLQVGGT